MTHSQHVCVGVAIVGTGDTECIYVLRSREKDTVVRVVRANQVVIYSREILKLYLPEGGVNHEGFGFTEPAPNFLRVNWWGKI